jgi:hypothetical protein
MSNLNDIELAGLIQEIHRWNLHLDRQMANGMEGALFHSLMLIEEKARKAQERLNKLRWVPQKEPMGG